MLAMHTARQAPPLFMCGEFDCDGTSSRFEFVFKSVNDGAAQGTSTYTVAKGDTLQSIAKAQLGDADLWFTIAQANGLADSAGLEEGQVLRIPAVVVTSTNNDDGTFEAYDPTAVIGDTTPVIPQPPKKKTNVLKMIVIIVAAVVLTVVTAGALSGVTASFAQAFAAGLNVMGVGAGVTGAAALGVGSVGASLGLGGTLAVAGAVGSIGSQLVGMALGEQDKFSWKQVGLSALGGYIGAGLQGVNFTNAIGATTNAALNSTANVVVRAAVGNALTQGIGYATGLQDHFSWRSVALSAVSAGVGKAMGEALGNTTFNDAFGKAGGQFARDVTTRLVSGTVAQAVTNKGGRVNFGQVAADAFGNALGNSIAQGIASSGSQQAQKVALAGMDHEYGIWGQPQTVANTYPVTSGPVESRDLPPTYLDSDDESLAGRMPRVGTVGKEGAQGAWGIARSLAPAGANDGQINTIKNQLLKLNPELVDGVSRGQRYYIPDANTPQDLALGRVGDSRYTPPAGTGGTLSSPSSGVYDDTQRFLANSSARGLSNLSVPSSAPRIETKNQFLQGFSDRIIERTEAEGNRSPLQLPTAGRTSLSAQLGAMVADAADDWHQDLMSGNMRPSAQTLAATRPRSSASKPVDALDTGTYGTQAPRSVGDGMSPDHIPSYAAIRLSVESKLGRPLSPAEATKLRNETNTLMIDTDMHQDSSRTYGGRNSQPQISSDARNLGAAALRDEAALRPALVSRGYTKQQIDDAFARLHAANRAKGLY